MEVAKSNHVPVKSHQDLVIGDALCTNGTVHTVVAEAHREEKTDEVCGKVSSRKRTAGTSEMDDVLTPGQRSGVKSSKKEVSLTGSEGKGNERMNSSRDKGGIGGVNKPSAKKEFIQQDSIVGLVPRQRGKPPLLK